MRGPATVMVSGLKWLSFARENGFQYLRIPNG